MAISIRSAPCATLQRWCRYIEPTSHPTRRRCSPTAARRTNRPARSAQYPRLLCQRKPFPAAAMLAGCVEQLPPAREPSRPPRLWSAPQLKEQPSPGTNFRSAPKRRGPAATKPASPHRCDHCRGPAAVPADSRRRREAHVGHRLCPATKQQNTPGKPTEPQPCRPAPPIRHR